MNFLRVDRDRLLPVLIVLIIFPALPLGAQDSPALESSLLENLKWRNIGPAVTGGRIVDFAVVESDPHIFYAATASGGAWKTTNGGVTWEPVFEKEKTVAIGGIAVSASNPNVVWIGTGEPNARNLRSSSWGDGVYKSEDGGKTWKNMGLELSQHTGRIVIHPEDPDTVYISCAGTMWGNDEARNEARGLFKTTDGGENWKNILSLGKGTGVVDVVMDPRNADVLYAAAWQRERRDWSYVNVGPEGGVFKTTDGGENWGRLVNGLPKDEVGRIGLSICRSRPDTLYAVTEGREHGLYRSDDRGASWEHRSSEVSASMYYGQVRCDPNDPERVYVLSTQLSISDDGGKSFSTEIPREGVHVDHHALWINPDNSSQLILGNDGGIYLSYDRGKNWRFVANLPITQFYTVAVDMKEPFYYVYGGTQDNNSLGGPSGTRNRDGIVNDDWYVTVGGDGFFLQIDPTDPSIVYTESQYGRLVRFDTRTGERRLIQPQPPEGEHYRWNWSAPILLSQHDPDTVYFGAQYLFRSTNRGDAWEVLGSDMTRRIEIDPKYRISDYGTIRIIAESPFSADRLAVGTDDGLVQLTRDGGKTWRRIESFPGIPERAQVTRLVLSAHEESTIYAAFSAHEDNDFRPFVLQSRDLGETWTSIAGDLPESEPVRAFVEHPKNPRLLFVGTELGPFVSMIGGTHWVSLKNNLPTVPIHDMVIQSRENDLVLGTHGRGFWILDSINILDELTQEVLSSDAYVARVRPATQMHLFDRGRGSQGQSYFAASNPPAGAIIDYYVSPALMTPPEKKDEEETEWKAPQVNVDILDADGLVIRRLEPEQGEKGAGIQRMVWDLRHPLAYEPDADERYSFFHGDLRGPFVLPGGYHVRLKIGDNEERQPIEVGADPFISIGPEDRQIWHDTLVSLNQMIATAKAVLSTSDAIEKQMKSVDEALEARGMESSPIAEDAKTVTEAVETVKNEMAGGRQDQPDPTAPTPVARLLRSLYNNIELSTAAPTADQRRLVRRAHERLSGQVEDLNRIVGETLPALHRKLDEAGISWTGGRKITLSPLPK